MRRALILLALTALCVAGGLAWWWFQHGPGRWHPTLSSRELAMRGLAQHLVSRFPGAKALVVGNPFTLRPGQASEIYAFERASLDGLKQGFGSAGSLQVDYPALRTEFLRDPASVWVDPKTTTPVSYLVTEDSFDRLAAAHPGVDLIISLVGLPLHVRRSELWRAADKPRFALLFPDWRLVGDTDAVRESIQSGKIAAAVLRRPGGPSDDEPITYDDETAEFNRRFLLVNKENVDGLIQRYPRSFQVGF